MPGPKKKLTNTRNIMHFIKTRRVPAEKPTKERMDRNKFFKTSKLPKNKRFGLWQLIHSKFQRVSPEKLISTANELWEAKQEIAKGKRFTFAEIAKKAGVSPPFVTSMNQELKIISEKEIMEVRGEGIGKIVKKMTKETAIQTINEMAAKGETPDQIIYAITMADAKISRKEVVDAIKKALKK